MKYIVFCVVFAALVAVSVADNLLAESTSSEQVSLLSRKGKLERARVAKKMSKGNAEASEDDATELIELEENSEAGFGGWRSRGGHSSRRVRRSRIGGETLQETQRQMLQ